MSGGQLARTLAGTAGLVGTVQVLPAVLGVPGVPDRFPGLTGPTRPGWIGLTFDDGPHPEGTPAVLDQLARAGVSATFFVLGEQLFQQPDLGWRIAEQGHELAVHGWHHRPLPMMRPGRIGRELADTCDLLTDITGVTPRWYRPPYGVATTEALYAAARLGLRPVWWNRWGRDWSAAATPARITGTVLGHAASRRRRLRGGDVVLLHDSDAYAVAGSWRWTAAAIPLILDQAARWGLCAGSLESAGSPSVEPIRTAAPRPPR